MKSNYIKHILFCIFIFVFEDAFSQHEFIMITNSHQSAISDSCHVYDDGGKNSPHATSVKNAGYTITSSNPNVRFRIISNVNINYNSYKAKVGL